MFEKPRVVAEPGPLDQAPQILLGGVRLPVAAEQALQDRIAERFPNISVMRVQGLLERAGGILDQVALAVRLLGSFAVITGLIILAGAIASTQLRRAREAALLKTLGITRPHHRHVRDRVRAERRRGGRWARWAATC